MRRPMPGAPEVIEIPLDRRALTRSAERHLHRAWEPEPPVFVFAEPGAGPLPSALLEPAGLAFLAAGPGSRLARVAIRRRAGLALASADWAAFALTGEALRIAVPFLAGAGLEVALAVDVARAGYPVVQAGSTGRRRAGRTAAPGAVHAYARRH